MRSAEKKELFATASCKKIKCICKSKCRHIGFLLSHFLLSVCLWNYYVSVPQGAAHHQQTSFGMLVSSISPSAHRIRVNPSSFIGWTRKADQQQQQLSLVRRLSLRVLRGLDSQGKPFLEPLLSHGLPSCELPERLETRWH